MKNYLITTTGGKYQILGKDKIEAVQLAMRIIREPVENIVEIVYKQISVEDDDWYKQYSVWLLKEKEAVQEIKFCYPKMKRV